MKNLIYLLLFTFLAIPAFAQTNNVSTNQPTLLEQAKDAAKAAMPTNLNQVMIEMLSGVKDAGKEIYGASKEAIHKSVDFVQEQAPEVIRQFLLWRFFKAFVDFLVYCSVAGVFFYFAYRLSNYSKDQRRGSDEQEMSCFFKWVFIIIACAIVIINGNTDVTEMVKIKVAPKVYIIEWVIDTARGQASK